MYTTGDSWVGEGETDENGSVVFSLKNAPSECYQTTVESVVAEGFSWDGTTPENGVCK